MNATFLQQILQGYKRLIKKADVKFVQGIYKYPECCKLKLMDRYPNTDMLRQYLPDAMDITLVNTEYLLNVD